MRVDLFPFRRTPAVNSVITVEELPDYAIAAITTRCHLDPVDCCCLARQHVGRTIEICQMVYAQLYNWTLLYLIEHSVSFRLRRDIMCLSFF